MTTVNPADGRDETEAQRDDRNLIELLQELRVAGLGVQVLFGFLLSIPFTTRFVRLSGPQRTLYVASLLLAAISTALLLAPVAYHRLVFRQHQKEHLVKAANIMAISGLAAVSLAIATAVLLVVSYVDSGLPVVLITAFTVCLFGGLWFVLPLTRRERRPRTNNSSPSGSRKVWLPSTAKQNASMTLTPRRCRLWPACRKSRTRPARSRRRLKPSITTPGICGSSAPGSPCAGAAGRQTKAGT
jgi:hypothetical protein